MVVSQLSRFLHCSFRNIDVIVQCFYKKPLFSSGFHFIWNSVPCIALGMNVSGVKVPFSLLSTNLTGQDLYTGSVFGIEGSILVLCVVFILTVALLQKGYRQGLGHKEE